MAGSSPSPREGEGERGRERKRESFLKAAIDYYKQLYLPFSEAPLVCSAVCMRRERERERERESINTQSTVK